MNKKYLIIGILIIIIALLCTGIAYMLLVDQTKYVTSNIDDSGTTLEIPDDMVIKSNNSESGIIVIENKNTIVIVFNSANKGLAQIIGFSDIKNPIFGSEFSGNLTINNPTVAGCSLEGQCRAIFIGNDETHDNIIVISKSNDIANHIINSIKWGKKTDSVSGETASSQPSAYAYKSDGTPMYSEQEVQDYMLNKYGMVDYHVGSNGYIDMDEPGYDDAGNMIDS